MIKKKIISISLIIILVLGFSVIVSQLSYAKEKTCGEMFLDCMNDWFAPLAAIGAAYCAAGYAFCEKYMK